MHLDPSQNQVRLEYDGKNKETKVLQFDRVFDPGCTQKQFYEQSGIPQMVTHLFDGFHATVFAYG